MTEEKISEMLIMVKNMKIKKAKPVGAQGLRPRFLLHPTDNRNKEINNHAEKL
jgi:hypothetical protein